MERMQDLDPVETGEWVDSLRAVLHHQGGARATYLLERLAEEAGRAGIAQPSTLNTPYVNTIPLEREERANWDRDIEHRIRSIIRWNAVAIILRANKESSELGGHIASFQSAATLYDIGFGHFWHAPSDSHGGDLIYICRGTRPQASTRAPSWKDGSAKRRCWLSARRPAARACRHIRIPG
jgi:pyruvate dehydrogenase E1 component